MILRFENEIDRKMSIKATSKLTSAGAAGGLLCAILCGACIANIMTYGGGYYIVNGVPWSTFASNAVDKFAATLVVGAVSSGVAMGISYAIKAICERSRR